MSPSDCLLLGLLSSDEQNNSYNNENRNVSYNWGHDLVCSTIRGNGILCFITLYLIIYYILCARICLHVIYFILSSPALLKKKLWTKCLPAVYCVTFERQWRPISNFCCPFLTFFSILSRSLNDWIDHLNEDALLSMDDYTSQHIYSNMYI